MKKIFIALVFMMLLVNIVEATVLRGMKTFTDTLGADDSVYVYYRIPTRALLGDFSLQYYIRTLTGDDTVAVFRREYSLDSLAWFNKVTIDSVIKSDSALIPDWELDPVLFMRLQWQTIIDAGDTLEVKHILFPVLKD